MSHRAEHPHFARPDDQRPQRTVPEAAASRRQRDLVARLNVLERTEQLVAMRREDAVARRPRRRRVRKVAHREAERLVVVLSTIAADRRMLGISIRPMTRSSITAGGGSTPVAVPVRQRSARPLGGLRPVADESRRFSTRTSSRRQARRRAVSARLRSASGTDDYRAWFTSTFWPARYALRVRVVSRRPSAAWTSTRILRRPGRSRCWPAGSRSCSCERMSRRSAGTRGPRR